MRVHTARTTLLRLGATGIFASLLLIIIGCGDSEAVLSSQPTYHGAVADVLSANCVACHSDGGIGPFPLDSPEWAVRMAPVIAYVVKEGIMPPWPPGPDTPPLENERVLSPETRSLLVAWAESGAPLGKPSERARRSNEEETGRQAEADLSLAVDPPYSPDPSKGDDYRCFLLDPQLDSDTFVTSYRVRPGLSTLVHHALIFVIGPENADEARLLDESEDGPGWTCFGGPGITSGIGGFGLLGFWVPGAAGSDFPEGTGKPLEAGSRLIMQLHYNLANPNGTAADASSVDLFLVEPSTDLKAIREIALAAPVEVRCPGPYPSDSSDPCNRSYALRESELKYLAQGIHVVCGTRPEHYLRADVGDGSAQPTQCDQQVHVDALAPGCHRPHAPARQLDQG